MFSDIGVQIPEMHEVCVSVNPPEMSEAPIEEREASHLPQMIR